jgi:hypothetical protein
MKEKAALLAIALSVGAAGCLAQDGCPPFAHIQSGDFGRTGDALWWTLQVEDLSGGLTFNQSAVPANFLEYRWAIDIDSDHDGDVDLRAAIEHFVLINTAAVTTTDILSQTSEDLWQVMGAVSSSIGTFTASIDGNTFRFDTTTAAAPALAGVTDRAQSSWKTVYRSGADPEDQCDEQWP